MTYKEMSKELKEIAKTYNRSLQDLKEMMSTRFSSLRGQTHRQLTLKGLF